MFTKGEDRVLYIKINNEYLPIGCLTGDSFSESSEMLDTTTRDNAGWKTSTPTLQSYNISFDGLVINTSDLGGDQTKISYDRLTLLKRNKTLIEWKSQDTLGVFVSVGKGYITELSDSSEIDGFISFNASIIGYGKPGDITDTYFTTTWRTTTPNETVTIPTNSSYTYNYNIRTSDGQFFTGVTGNKSITFTIPGDYDINIFGSFPSIYFNDTGDKEKIIDIKKWGNNVWGSFNSSFYGCSNLTGSYTDVANTVNVTNMGDMFRGATVFNSALTFDTSNVINMNRAFFSTASFNQPLNSWNTSNVTNMLGMFNGASSFNQYLNSWNTSNVTTMDQMFQSATSFNQPLNFNTSNVTEMFNMFRQASSFNSTLTFSDTSNVTRMNDMFRQATSFNQSLNFDTSSVTSMSNMFRETSDFNQPLNFDTSSVTNMNSMFRQATSFNQSLNFDTSNVTIINNMFAGATAFNGTLTFSDTSSITNMVYMFQQATSFNQPLNFDTSSVTTMEQMFNGASSFDQTLNFDTRAVTNIASMFYGATSFNQYLNSWNTSNVTTMFRLFKSASSFDQPLNFDTSNVTTMKEMFSNASSFDQTLNLDITSVTDMFNMFNGVTLSTTNYDAILIYWENELQTAFPNGSGYTPTISISFGASQYTGGGTAAAARASLVNNFNWTIIDGGIA